MPSERRKNKETRILLFVGEENKKNSAQSQFRKVKTNTIQTSESHNLDQCPVQTLLLHVLVLSH